jgi:hypothetical protein
MMQALFYAGAVSVLAARCPIFYESAEAAFVGTIERVFSRQMTFGAAMNDAMTSAMAQQDLKQLEQWALYGVFGHPFTRIRFV